MKSQIRITNNPGPEQSCRFIRHLAGRNLWPYGIILTFVLFISATVGLVVMACAQKVDLVSPDYYEQEIRFQSHLDRAGRTQALPAVVAYDAAAKTIRIELPKTIGPNAPGGQLHLYRPSAAGMDRHLRLEADEQGCQSLDAASLAPGLWKIRVSWRAGGEDYFLERSVTLK